MSASAAQDRTPDEARQVLDQVVSELRDLPYWKLRRRVKMDWPWNSEGVLYERQANSSVSPTGAVYVSLGAPTVRWRRGRSGAAYRVCVVVSWANPQRDLEVDVWIDEPDLSSEKVRFIDSFTVRPMRRSSAAADA
jgi:hypothetical protein